MATPPNYVGAYSNGGYYSLGQIILADGNPYGIAGAYYIRSGNPGNPGYPPGDTGSWSIYTMPKLIDGAGSITGSGNIMGTSGGNLGPLPSIFYPAENLDNFMTVPYIIATSSTKFQVGDIYSIATNPFVNGNFTVTSVAEAYGSGSGYWRVEGTVSGPTQMGPPSWSVDLTLTYRIGYL